MKLEQAARQALEMMDAGSYIPAMRVLREALAEPELNLNCKSVQKRLATVWGYVKAEQAEQEPVAWVGKGGFNECGEGQPLYAATVRTKDLTDDEIRAIRFNWERNEFAIDFARAVIAADREKNKCQH